MAEASLVNSIGRVAMRTGQFIEWDDILKSNYEFAPGVDQITAHSPAPLVVTSAVRYSMPHPSVIKARGVNLAFELRLLSSAPRKATGPNSPEIAPTSTARYLAYMSGAMLNVLAVVGSLNKNSVTRVVVSRVASDLSARGCAVDVLDLLEQPLALYNPELAHHAENFPSLQARVNEADVYVLGTPDYHGSISSAMKNFLDHFWHEFAGKLFAPIVASHEKGLTVTDQLRTVARQCYAWSLPYGVSFVDRVDVKEGQVVSSALRERLDMFVRDVEVYGRVLTAQRHVDLAGSEPGLMARHRLKRKTAEPATL